MRHVDIRITLEQMLQTKGFLRYSKLEVEEVNLHINNHLEKFVDLLVSQERNKNDYASNLTLVEYLGEIYVEDEISAFTGDGYKEFTKPGEFRNFSTCIANGKIDNAPVSIPCELRNVQFFTEFGDIPYYGSNKDSIKMTIINNKFRLYLFDSFSLEDIKLVYVKNPPVVDTALTQVYPLTNSFILHVIEQTAITLTKVLEHNQEKINNLQNK